MKRAFETSLLLDRRSFTCLIRCLQIVLSLRTVSASENSSCTGPEADTGRTSSHLARPSSSAQKQPWPLHKGDTGPRHRGEESPQVRLVVPIQVAFPSERLVFCGVRPKGGEDVFRGCQNSCQVAVQDWADQRRERAGVHYGGPNKGKGHRRQNCSDIHFCE